MPISLKPFKESGSTPVRRRFWDAAFAQVLASRKLAGRNADVSEYDGKGTVINLFDTSVRRPGGGGGPPIPTGACCYDDGTCAVTTSIDCFNGDGTYQGDNTTCAGVTCTGACCEPDCVPNQTPNECDLAGGTFQGFGTTCSPDPCSPPPPPTGACCFSDNSCSVLSPSECVEEGGTYHGNGTSCTTTDCGAGPCVDCGCPGDICCAVEYFPTPGHCAYAYYSVVSIACCVGFYGGQPLGPNGNCVLNEGACCNIPGVGCLDGNTILDCNCDAGVWQGIGTTCAGGCP